MWIQFFVFLQPLWHQERRGLSDSKTFQPQGIGGRGRRGGVNRENMRKNMKFWPLNPYYKRSDWKTWPSQIFSEALTFNLWKNNKKMLPKFTEMEENRILFTPYSFIKNLRQIHLRESHMKFTGKIHVIKIMWLDWSKQQNIQFSVNWSRKFICQYQARRPASKQALGL